MPQVARLALEWFHLVAPLEWWQLVVALAVVVVAPLERWQLVAVVVQPHDPVAIHAPLAAALVGSCCAPAIHVLAAGPAIHVLATGPTVHALATGPAVHDPELWSCPPQWLP